MPIYEYICADCNHVFEKLKRISQSDEQQLCEKCDGLCNKVLNAPRGLHFNGDGFYETEHGKQKHRKNK